MSQTYDWKKALLDTAPMDLGPSQVLALQVHTSELLDEIVNLNMQINKLIYTMKEINQVARDHEDSVSSYWLENITQDILKEMGELK